MQEVGEGGEGGEGGREGEGGEGGMRKEMRVPIPLFAATSMDLSTGESPGAHSLQNLRFR